MESLKNILAWLNDNYAILSAIAIFVLALGVKISKTIKDYQAKSNEEKQVWINEQIEIAKKALENAILKLISESEIKWSEYIESGEIKRSEIFDIVYKNYPDLVKYLSKDELEKYIDMLIDNALETLRDIVSKTEKVNECLLNNNI